ncbi:DUF1289 domain-containing protein [Shewanella sp. HL-SH4]|uniref:DUF1289 domain-containing protein n=1 Tax=unclassified Shewanella TaxID=196818 RepID=UPI003EBD6974
MHSPCVARCGLNEDDFCMGCYRHVDEIVIWSQANDQQQQHILDQLESRKLQFADSKNSQTLSRAKWLDAEKRLL